MAYFVRKGSLIRLFSTWRGIFALDVTIMCL